MKLGNAFGIHEQALMVRNQRNELLASNIANADTPGYKARDIDFKQVLKAQTTQPVRLAATRAGHIQPSKAAMPMGYVQFRNVSQPSLDGNTVDVQVEQVEFAKNSAQFDATMRFLDGKVKILEKALKGQ